jgi:hypothetical protein
MTKQLLVESSEIGLDFNSKKVKGLKAFVESHENTNGFIVRGIPVNKLDNETLNGRTYPGDEVQKSIDNAKKLGVFDRKSLLGQMCDHPSESSYVKPSDVSHVITNAYIQEINGNKFLMFDILVPNTENGKNLQALLIDGIALGTSVRGLGELDDNNRVYDYELLGFDMVAEPASPIVYEVDVDPLTTSESKDGCANIKFNIKESREKMKEDDEVFDETSEAEEVDVEEMSEKSKNSKNKPAVENITVADLGALPQSAKVKGTEKGRKECNCEYAEYPVANGGRDLQIVIYQNEAEPVVFLRTFDNEKAINAFKIENDLDGISTREAAERLGFIEMKNGESKIIKSKVKSHNKIRRCDKTAKTKLKEHLTDNNGDEIPDYVLEGISKLIEEGYRSGIDNPPGYSWDISFDYGENYIIADYILENLAGPVRDGWDDDVEIDISKDMLLYMANGYDDSYENDPKLRKEATEKVIEILKDDFKYTEKEAREFMKNDDDEELIFYTHYYLNVSKEEEEEDEEIEEGKKRKKENRKAANKKIVDGKTKRGLREGGGAGVKITLKFEGYSDLDINSNDYCEIKPQGVELESYEDSREVYDDYESNRKNNHGNNYGNDTGTLKLAKKDIKKAVIEELMEISDNEIEMDSVELIGARLAGDLDGSYEDISIMYGPGWMRAALTDKIVIPDISMKVYAQYYENDKLIDEDIMTYVDGVYTPSDGVKHVYKDLDSYEEEEEENEDEEIDETYSKVYDDKNKAQQVYDDLKASGKNPSYDSNTGEVSVEDNNEDVKKKFESAKKAVKEGGYRIYFRESAKRIAEKNRVKKSFRESEKSSVGDFSGLSDEETVEILLQAPLLLKNKRDVTVALNIIHDPIFDFTIQRKRNEGDFGYDLRGELKKALQRSEEENVLDVNSDNIVESLRKIDFAKEDKLKLMEKLTFLENKYANNPMTLSEVLNAKVSLIKRMKIENVNLKLSPKQNDLVRNYSDSLILLERQTQNSQTKVNDFSNKVKDIKENVKETLCQIADHLEENETKIDEMQKVINEAENTVEETQRLLTIAVEVANALYKKLKSLEE